MNRYEFVIRYTRTSNRIVKDMLAETEAQALSDLQAIQKDFAGGASAFEIEGVDYPPITGDFHPHYQQLESAQ